MSFRCTFNSKQFIKDISLLGGVSKAGADLTLRAILFKYSGNILSAYVFDGSVGASVVLSVGEVSTPGDIDFILDYDSLLKVLKFCRGEVCLIHSDYAWYVEFDDGKINIPELNVRRDRIYSSHFDPSGVVFGGAVGFSSPVALDVAKVFLTSGPNGYSEDLDFLYFKDGSSFLSNGYSVVKLGGFRGVKTSIRKADIALVKSLFDRGPSEVQMGVGEKVYFRIPGKALVFFPQCQEEFPQAYSDYVSQIHDKKDEFVIDFNDFYKAITVLSKVYQASGAVALKSEGGILTLESSTVDEKVSSIALSKNKDADPGVVYFGVDNALVSLRCLKQFPEDMRLVLYKESFSVFDDDVQSVVFGTTQAIRSVMGKLGA